MTDRQRRRLSPEARREEILGAAETLLRERGGDVRVEEVMGLAGGAKGTFYAYFPAWEDMLEALRARVFDAFDEAYPLPVEREAPVDWPATLAAISEAFIDFNVGMERLHEALFHSDFAQSRPPADHLDPVVRIAAMIRAGQEAEAFGDVDPEPTAAFLFAAIHEAADAVAAGDDRARTLRALRVLLIRALAPDPA